MMELGANSVRRVLPAEVVGIPVTPSSDYFSPVKKEVRAYDLHVEGELPRELCGALFRIGPNAAGPGTPWGQGEGMVHSVAFADGNAVMYGNRWLRTRLWRERMHLAVGSSEKADTADREGLANTSLIRHADRLLAISEGGIPTEFSPQLCDEHVFRLHRALRGGTVAHPKVDPRTGELFLLTYGGDEGHGRVGAYCISASGDEIARSTTMYTGRDTRPHDMGLTDHYIVVLDLPRPRTNMEPSDRRSRLRSCRVGLLARNCHESKPAWIDARPCFVYHILNAYERTEEVVMTLVVYPRTMGGGREHFGRPTLSSWTLNTRTGSFSEEILDELPQEFPRIDDRVFGQENRYGYTTWYAGAGTIEMRGINVWDFKCGSRSSYDFGAKCRISEAVFAPAGPEVAEGAGYLLTIVYNLETQSSGVAVMDVTRGSAELRAWVDLPYRVPAGHHGVWVSGVRGDRSLEYSLP
ncbi:MAG: carotenoid oxygenase family protein [Gammaproteobacteria bacterium]